MSILSVNPLQSGYVSYGDQDENYNDNDWLRCGVQSSTSIQYQALVQFGISAIPAGSTVNSATLKLYSYSNSCYSAETTILAKRITSSWDYTDVQYDNKPTTTSTNQASTTDEDYGTWFEWDVVDIVQAWVNGTSNYGFYMIQDGLTTARGKCFKRTSTYVPVLEIDYDPLNMWVSDGSAWQKAKELHVHDGTQWRQADAGGAVHNGAGWQTFM